MVTRTATLAPFSNAVPMLSTASFVMPSVSNPVSATPVVGFRRAESSIETSGVAGLFPSTLKPLIEIPLASSLLSKVLRTPLWNKN